MHMMLFSRFKQKIELDEVMGNTALEAKGSKAPAGEIEASTDNASDSKAMHEAVKMRDKAKGKRQPANSELPTETNQPNDKAVEDDLQHHAIDKPTALKPAVDQPNDLESAVDQPNDLESAVDQPCAIKLTMDQPNDSVPAVKHSNHLEPDTDQLKHSEAAGNCCKDGLCLLNESNIEQAASHGEMQEQVCLGQAADAEKQSRTTDVHENSRLETAADHQSNSDPVAEQLEAASNCDDGFRLMSEEDMIKSGEIDELSYLGQAPDELKELLEKQGKIMAVYENIRDLNILITGVTGSGKSTLVNAFLGHNIATEGHEISRRGTSGVKGMKSVREQKIGIKVWDTPGLMDGRREQKRYLREILVVWEKYQPGDLVIFCVKVDTRFVDGIENSNVQAMIKLKKKCGQEFWRKTIIVLTFANTIESLHPEWGNTSPVHKAKQFQEIIQEYRKVIRKNLIDHVGVTQEIANNIKVVPAGHKRSPELLDRKHWFSTLWFQCLDSIPTEEGKATFVFYSRNQLVDETYPGKKLDQIVLTDDFVPERLLKLRTKYGIHGGLLGMLGGPLGVLTIPLGWWAGKRRGEVEYIEELRKHSITVTSPIESH